MTASRPVAAGLIDGVQFAWQAASDDGTPTASLTCKIDLRPLAQPASGAARLPQPGPLGTGTNWSLHSPAPGDNAWSLRAVDNAWVAGTASTGTIRTGSADRLFQISFE
jgi:hypothetical protein